MDPFHRPQGYGYGHAFSRGGSQQPRGFGHQPHYRNQAPPFLPHGSGDVNFRQYSIGFPTSGAPLYSQPRQHFPGRGGQGNPPYFERPARGSNYRPRGRGYGSNQFAKNQFGGRSEQGIACYFKPSMLEDPWKDLVEKSKQSQES